MSYWQQDIKIARAIHAALMGRGMWTTLMGHVFPVEKMDDRHVAFAIKNAQGALVEIRADNGPHVNELLQITKEKILVLLKEDARRARAAYDALPKKPPPFTTRP